MEPINFDLSNANFRLADKCDVCITTYVSKINEEKRKIPKCYF